MGHSQRKNRRHADARKRGPQTEKPESQPRRRGHRPRPSVMLGDDDDFGHDRRNVVSDSSLFGGDEDQRDGFGLHRDRDDYGDPRFRRRW